MATSQSAGSGERPTVGRVLIVDDDPMVARAIALILSAYSVDTVHSGAHALARIAEGWHYDVILCDVMMPSMTGPEFLELLLKTAPAAAARVVFITGGAARPDVRRVLDRVSHPVLEKPVNIDTLRTLVDGRVLQARDESSERSA
jgi:CheY-like chemotaxis protein